MGGVKPGPNHRLGLLCRYTILSPVVVKAGSKIKLDARAVVDRRPVVIGGRRIRRIRVRGRRNSGRIRVRLVHVEVDSLRDTVFRAEQVAGSENPGLDILVCCHRQRADDVIIRPKIVKRSVFVAEDFEVNRRVANNLPVRFDFRSGRG